MVARLNMGGPAHQVSLLSGCRFFPDRYETVLVHGRLPEGEESAAYLAEREGARLLRLPNLVQPVSPSDDLRALGSLVRLIREFRPQIVHTHTAKAGFLGRQAALLAARAGARPKLVHTFHGHVLEGYFSPAASGVFRRLEHWLGRRSDALIGVSEPTVAALVALGVAERSRFRVIRLGLDLEPLAKAGEDPALRTAARAELGFGPEDVVCLYVGRIVPIKRLDRLIEAFARAHRADSRCRLLVVGDGADRPRFESRARELGLERAIRFAGYRSELAPLFAAADLAVLSSDNEGTPVSLIEAAAAARPAVATEVGGVGEVVGEEGGLVVGPEDIPSLGAAIARLAGDPELRGRMGRSARERVLPRYGVERLLGDIDSLYGELLEADPAPVEGSSP